MTHWHMHVSTDRPGMLKSSYYSDDLERIKKQINKFGPDDFQRLVIQQPIFQDHDHIDSAMVTWVDLDEETQHVERKVRKGRNAGASKAKASGSGGAQQEDEAGESSQGETGS